VIVLDRRALLRWASATTGALWLPRSAWSQARVLVDPFYCGVASGSPTADGVVLWTRLNPKALRFGPDATAAVGWELAHDAQFARVVQRGQSLASAALGWSVHVELAGLEPARGYHYRFLLGDAISATGQTRTLPAPGSAVTQLRLAYASCQKWEDGYFSAWRHLHADAPDLVLFLGDYLYEYPGASSKLRRPGGGWVLTLDDYRARYALYKSDPDLQAMHAACPWLMTWDDHEVQNDYAGLQAGTGLLSAPDFAGRRAAAYQAYYENMPLRTGVLTQALTGLAQGAELRLYGQLAYGNLAQLYLLDARQYKDPQVCNPDGKTGSSIVRPETCPSWNDPARSLLGGAQEKWLSGALASAAISGARWNVLGQQTLLGPRDFALGPAQKLWNDGWDGYSAARTRLTTALQQPGVANPVVLGGDVHENWVGHVLADYARPESKKVGVEFCGTSITSKAGKTDSSAALLQENPHFVFANAQYRGYGLADFTPGQLNVRLRVLDDVQRQDSTVSTLAAFAVEAGRAEVLPV
jgi:alkaline phosphatase D